MNNTDPIEIAPNIFFIGVFDPDIRTFDIIMKTANGSSYNAYLIKTSEGVIIVDTVKLEFQEQFFKKIEKLCSYDEIKYVICHHLEPDHAGAIPELMERASNAKVLISPQATAMLKAITHKENIDFETVWTNKSLKLGNKTITFLTTPYLHWPETMSSYIVEDKLLFSGDVFGSHYYDKRVFDDLVGDFFYAFKYYYDHIMRPFKTYALNAIKLYDKLEIDIIATLHGPILRDNPQKYINYYRKWSQPNQKVISNGEKILSIFYLTSYKNTKDMAEAIYEGADSVEGIVANVYDLASIEESNMINILEESDGILIGTPTINADAPKPVWDLLSCMMLLEKRGKVGGAFGSYGWSGEAVDMIIHRLKSLNFRVPPLQYMKIKLIPTKEELKDCYNYGVEIAEVLNGKMIELTMN
ncbi:FprA family A-type flavoprotein [Halarcobacter ebronensis]|uniref:MBL fold metallo-hydrolase n=1 Tax=Halarcobacter ebronensis TaxID=1462615 RepID=A0A4Q1AQ01_9BACT|nr:FprA family A-type flavoprotein [Halarcobacter ebronensis]QKF80621.1 flavorubredoxin [Halarcobacter ebronensis]RXK08422.1 MBL fold metallo-hydrolase [Halarcobacter ebronensis]